MNPTNIQMTYINFEALKLFSDTTNAVTWIEYDKVIVWIYCFIKQDGKCLDVSANILTRAKVSFKIVYF